jgi:ABC-type branched-subunit amino acid transport system ATPase component
LIAPFVGILTQCQGLRERIAVMSFSQLIALGNTAEVQHNLAVIPAYLGHG